MRALVLHTVIYSVNFREQHCVVFFLSDLDLTHFSLGEVIVDLGDDELVFHVQLLKSKEADCRCSGHETQGTESPDHGARKCGLGGRAQSRYES